MKLLMYLSVVALLLLSSCGGTAPKPFVGKIRYEISPVDTALQKLIPTSKMVVYTNDTISRIETENPIFGKQITIKHLELKKSYLLVSFQGANYAIQTSETMDTVKVEPYAFEKIKGKSNPILDQKTAQVEVSKSTFDAPIEVVYFAEIRPDLLDVFEGIKGLPAIYQMNTKDGLMQYRAIELEEGPVSRDLFGIPSDYQRISLEAFLDLVMPKEN